MKIGSLDTQSQVIIIAEIGVNHEGDEKAAEKMIRLAAASGADIVKFQTFKVGRYVSPAYGQERLERLKKFELSFDAFRRLAGVAKEENVLFLSAALDLERARCLEEIVPAFKIASGDNDFFPLMRQTAQTGKPLIVSSGLADLEILKRAKECIEGIWRDLSITQEMAVLHCVSSYPVPPQEANLASIPFLKEKLGCVVGYSDHTLGLDAPLMAAAMGARIIEKHFTLDKNYSEFRDHRLSATPDELKNLVKKIREL